jgi:tRNA(Ile)-lysidine synthase
MMLRDLHTRGTLAKLVLAHLNHQLRGAESDADEAFVVELARVWNLPARAHRLDVASAAKRTGVNLEDTARRLRYDWLTQVAREEGARWVATGHSADDQAETVLFRLLRGTGLEGLSGMAERRGLAEGVDLVRPFLRVRRSAILAFLEEKQQAFRRDSSNTDTRLTRNRLRQELLPALAEEYNPAIIDILCRLAEQAREAQTEVAHAAERLLERSELPRAGRLVILDAEELREGSRHLRREVFRILWRREQWPMGRMTFKDWARLAGLVERKSGALELPEGIKARRTGRVVQLEPKCGTP